MVIHYEVAAFVSLNLFTNTSSDTVVSFVLLMNGPDYEEAIKEFYRVLRESRDLFFSIAHSCLLTKGFNWIRDEQGNAIKLYRI